MAEMWRRYWPVDLLAVVFLIVAVLFGSYLNHRQQIGNQRAENTRESLCAIIDRIPLRVDVGVDKARKLDRCLKVPHPPTVFFGHPFPTPSPAPAVTVTPAPRPVSSEATAPAGATPAPTVTRTIRPTPRPTPSSTPTRRPSPTPSPTRTCTVHVGPVCV